MDSKPSPIIGNQKLRSMEGEVLGGSIITASMLGAQRMQTDSKGTSRRNFEPSNMHTMPQQLSMAERSHRRWILLSKGSLIRIHHPRMPITYFFCLLLYSFLNETCLLVSAHQTKHIQMTEQISLQLIMFAFLFRFQLNIDCVDKRNNIVKMCFVNCARTFPFSLPTKTSNYPLLNLSRLFSLSPSGEKFMEIFHQRRFLIQLTPFFNNSIWIIFFLVF